MFVIRDYPSFYRKTGCQKFGVTGYLYLYRPTLYQNFVKTGHQYVQWWTHKIGGLHKNDFITAAKSDDIFSP